MIKILIIEDEQGMVDLWKDYVSKWGADVVIAMDYATAEFEMGKIPPPDIVFLDLVLPDSRAPEETLRRAVEMIRENNPNAVIIVITGANSAKIAQLAISVGADSFQLKHDMVGQQNLWSAVRRTLQARKSSARGCAEACLTLVEKLNSLLGPDAA